MIILHFRFQTAGTNNRLSESSLNSLKSDGLSVRNIGKPQVAFRLAVLLFMSTLSFFTLFQIA